MGSRRNGLTGALVALSLTGVLAGACSSSSSSSSSSGRPPVPSRSSSTTSSSTTSVTPPPPTSSVPSGPARCAIPALSGSVAGRSGGAGTIEITVALQSTSATSCVLTGYPGLQLLGPADTSLPTQVVRKGSYSFTSMAPTTVTLSNGQSAYFNIGYSDVPVGNEQSCPSSTSLEVTPPDATDHLVVPAVLSPCGGGTLVVSPVFAATGTSNPATGTVGG
ncbi:MAG TPA: DUF4232 domain-containing protein [Acidimicrobiales bacterium]|nr:DUF4232 domain-containing protein [Acidimicrobiales bacterium]